MSEIVKDMINAIVSDDQIDAEAKFKSALSTKVGQALDDKRVTVAKDWLSAGDELEATQDAAGLDKLGQEDPVEIEDPSEVETEAENDTEVQEV